jgi:hypothetical protein
VVTKTLVTTAIEGAKKQQSTISSGSKSDGNCNDDSKGNDYENKGNGIV